MTPCQDDPPRGLDWSEPVSVGGETTLRTVATVLDACAVGAANVRDPAAPGMVSERDVVAALVAGGDPDALWASDVMTPGLVTVSTATSIITAARLMLDVGTRHLAIADGDDIVSVVSMRDLQSALVDELLGGGDEPA